MQISSHPFIHTQFVFLFVQTSPSRSVFSLRESMVRYEEVHPKTISSPRNQSTPTNGTDGGGHAERRATPMRGVAERNYNTYFKVRSL